MKKIRNIGLIIGLIILISSNSNAQYFYTSYGSAHDWYVPKFIDYTIQNNYFGYEIAHVKKYNRHGYTNFNVLLHRNGWFVELRFDRHGHIYKTVNHRWDYPLMSHRCTGHCGYHHNYYTAYYPKYHHKHYRQNHHKTVYVNTHHGQNKQNHTNYYTNVRVEKQQNHNQGNRNSNVKNGNGNQDQRTNGSIRKPPQRAPQSQKIVSNKSNNQQPRNSTVTRKPQQTNNSARYSRPQQNGSNKRTTYSSSGSSTNSRRAVAYKNERGNRGN